MSQSDPAYFEKQKEALNNFLQNRSESFSERNIYDIRDRLSRISEESHSERTRDPNHQNLQNYQKWFIENSLNFVVYVLSNVEPQISRNVKFNVRAATVELLQKKILLQHMTQSVVDQLTIVLEKDNENNAAIAIRIMNDLLKTNQQQSHQYQRSNSIFTDALLLKLFNFFEQRIEFLVKFNNELKKSQYKKLMGDNQINAFHDQTYVLQHENDDNNNNNNNNNNKREKDIRLNIYSLSFVTNIPPFFIYTIFALDSIIRDETKTQMREVLKRALKTMNQVINETNFQDLLQKVPRNIVQELFNAYSKFLQLFALTIKRDESQMQSQSRIIKDLADTVKLDQVVATIIKTLKHCPVDIMHIRIDISNRLKQAMIQKRDPVQPNEMQDKINEINANVVELIDEETIVGKNLKIPPFQKSSIYHNWLEIVKHVVQSYLPKSDQSPQQMNNLEKMQTDFINNQIYMEKIFNTIFKLLFDSSLQLQIHEKALDLIKIFLDLFSKQQTYFIDKNLLQFYVDQTQQQQNDKIFKKITKYSPKYKLLDRLFSMIGMKLNQIRKQIQQIKQMLIRTQRWGITKKTTPQTNVASIPSNPDALNENYISQLEQYILESEIDIDHNLITQQDQTATQVYTYDDEEEFQINSLSISNYTQYVEFAKDLKSKVFDQLNDILQKLLIFVTSTNKEIINKQKNRTNYIMPTKITPFIQVISDNKPYLSNIQCHYMSKILKNGLMIFDELHDHQRNHFEILDYKKKTISQFMQFFIQFQDPINFKNIFEPNSKLILKISVNLIKTCPEINCLPILLQDHLGFNNQQSDSQNPHKQSIKYYIEFLLHLYLKELQTTPELPTKFGYIRGGQLMKNQMNIQQKDQDEYISLIQKLLRIPIRQFPRVKCQQNEEPIVKPLVKQLILFFVKKTHETYYPIDFLGLLLSLVKRIQNNDQGEGLSKYFQQLCDKYDRNDKQQMIQRQQYELYHRLSMSGVNIVLNMFELFQTGIVEIQDIVAEVIANFPLQKTIQINLARQYPIFAQCLFRALHNISTIENQVIQKTLMMLENIVTNLSMEEMKEFFGDLLQPFIEKLLTFPSEYKMADIYSKQVNLFLDPSFKSLKILSKLGSLVRKSEWPIEIKRNHTDNSYKRNQYLEVQIEGLQSSIKLNLTETVRCAVEILQNVLEQQLATYLFKQSSIQHSYSIVKQVLLGYYQMPIQFDHDLYNYQIPQGMALEMKLQSRQCEQDHLIYQDEELIFAVTKVFIGLSNFHNIIQTLTTATFHKIKEDVENVVTTLSEMFFIQLADDHCEIIEKIKSSKPDINSLFTMTETIVQNYLILKPQCIKWISFLFRGLNKRYMLTAEENMNFKDFYIQQHEFIWNKLLMGNCLKKYKKILDNHMQNHQNKKWAYDVYYSVVIRLFEEFVYEKFGKQTQLQKEDDRRRKIQIVQSYGGTMIPSEGLNCRSISIELLTEIQNLLPKFEDYYKSTQIVGLPYIPDQRIIECSFMLLRQLPESIKVISQQLTKNLLNQTLNQLIKNLNYDHSIYEYSHQSILLLQDKLRCFIKIVTQNCLTYKKSILQICTDLFDTVITQHFNENSGSLFYMNIGQEMKCNHEDKIESIPLDNLQQLGNGPNLWVNIEFSEILISPYTQNTVLKELVIIIKQLCEEQKMSDIIAQKYANGFRILTYLLRKQGLNKQGQYYYLFKTVILNQEPHLELKIEEYVQRSYKILQQNEEQYSKQSKLILNGEDSQSAYINVSHALDDLDFKINIEDIDFEIKWQSQMVVSIFGFLKQIATINYIYAIQKYLLKSIDKNFLLKPSILSMKYKTVEILYEGLLRVEQSIRQSSYKYLQELVQQEGIQNDKTLFENDERLKKIMKPLLTCVQSEIFHYVPSFLKSLKLILKLFSKVFHRTLSDRLQLHLQKIVQDNFQQYQNNIQTCTTMEWQSYQQQQSQESLNFQMGIIFGLLKLFQHLTFQQANQGNGPLNYNIVQKIIQDKNTLRRNYIFKISQNQLNQSIDKPLVKFLNTLAANSFEIFQQFFSNTQIQQFQKQLENVNQILCNQTTIKNLQEQIRERLQYIKTIRQVISEPSAYPLREKLCREKQQLFQKIVSFNKTIQELSSSLEKGLLSNQIQLTQEQLQSFHQQSVQKLINGISKIQIEIIQFGFELCKHNPSCLKRNTQILENFILKNIKDLLERQKNNNNQNKSIQINQLQFAYNQLILSNQQINSLLNKYCSMLKQYINQNEDNKLAIQGMLKLILYSTQDKVKKWIINVAMNKSIQLRKIIIEIWMDNFKYFEDESINQVQMTIGFHVIYPILFYSNQRNDLAQISQLKLFERIKDINEDLVKQYSKILSDIEHHAPMNFTYKLQNGLAIKLSDVNNFYKSSVIDMLQISSYLICFQEQQLPQDLKMSYLSFGYDMINKSDKLVAFYANLYFSKYLKKNQLIQNDPISVNKRIVRIYTRAIKQLDESGQSEQELYSLCKKIISVILPWLDEVDVNDQKDWIQATQQLLKQEQPSLDSEQAQKVSRFWSMFIKNHKIFHRHHESFNIHIINSMQQIGFYSSNQNIQTQLIPNSYQNYRRIALDMAFLQVEWKTQLIKGEIQQKSKKFKESFYQIEPQHHDEALSSEIYQSFFIKQSLKAHSLEDSELSKRALYLLKKILIIAPLTNQKMNMETLKKNIANLMNQVTETQQPNQNQRTIQQQPTTSSYFRYFMIVLHILMIISEFQQPQRIPQLFQPYFDIIFLMHQLPDQLSQQMGHRPNTARMPPTQPRPINQQQRQPYQSTDRTQQHQTALNQDYAPLIFSIYCIFRKLLKVAKEQQNELSEQFYNNLSNWVKDAIQGHPQFRRSNQQQAYGQQRIPVLAIKVNILSIFLLKLLFNQNQTYVCPLLPALKRIAEILIEYMKTKDKGDQYLDNLCKYQIPKRQFNIREKDNLDFNAQKQYTHANLSQYIADFAQMTDDFPFGIKKSEEVLYFSEDFPENQKIKFHLHRSALQKTIKMMTYNFDEIKDQREQLEFLQLLISIIESVPDYELKLECIAIMRLLFINGISNKEGYLLAISTHLSPIRSQQVRLELQKMEDNKQFKASKMPYEVQLNFFFDINRLQNLFDKKIDQRSSDSYDNNHGKIQDLKVLKLYFMFLCELLLVHPFKKQQDSINSGFYYLKNIFDKSSGSLREFRRILQVISKLSTCLDYLQFFYKMILDIYGYTYDRFLQFLLGDQTTKQQDQPLQTEGEEIMLMAIKFLILGRGQLKQPIQFQLQQSNKIIVKLVPQSDDSNMREQVLNKYLAIYYRKKQWIKLYNSSLKLITSEYLPSIVIYNLSYIPLQDQPQQPLRECIIPSAAIELMGTAANVSSRLLRPLFNQVIVNDLKTITQLTEYLQQQSLSYGTMTTISNYLVQDILSQMQNIHQVLDQQQIQLNFNNLIACLRQKNQLPLCQYLLEQIFQYLSGDCEYYSLLNEDILVQLQGIYQEQWNKQSLLGCKCFTATQPWVKQLVLMNQLREPAQQYQLILNNQEQVDQFWQQLEQETHEYQGIQKEYDQQIIHQFFSESLQQLNQWNTLKQVDLSKVQTVQNKIIMGFREKQKDLTDQGWKELNILSEVKQNIQQNDIYCYNQAYFKLLDFVRDDSQQNQHGRIGNHVLQSIEQHLKYAQIINCYNFIKTLPKLTQSYDQMMSSPQLWGQKFLNFVSQFQLYTEFEESLRQYAISATVYPNQQQGPHDMLLDQIYNGYQSSLLCKKYLFERQPTNIDQQEFTFDLISQRMIQLQMCLHRFNGFLTQFINAQQQMPTSISLDLKSYQLSILDYKTILYPIRYYQQNGIFELFDEQSILKEVPKPLQIYAEKIYQLEKIKFKTIKIQEVDQNNQQLTDLLTYFSNLQMGTYSSEEFKAYMISKIRRYKMINQCYKLLRLDSQQSENQSNNNNMQTEEPKLEQMVSQTNEYFIQNQINYLKFWREVQKVYQLAHKKYSNNIKFAQNYIQVSSIGIQYKPQKFTINGMYMFHIINITNPTDSIVIDAFSQTIGLIPLHLLQRFLIQLISTYLKSPSEQIRKDCLEYIDKLCKYNPLNNFQVIQYFKSLGLLIDDRSQQFVDHFQNSSKLSNQIANIYSISYLFNNRFDSSVWDTLEELIYLCGKVLDQKYYESNSINVNEKCLQIVNLIQKYHQTKDHFKQFFPVNDLQKWIKNDQLKAITSIYIASLKLIYGKLFGFQINSSEDFSQQLSCALNTLATQQIQITQLYALNDEFIMNQYPMLGQDGQLKRTQVIENVYITSMFPTINIMFLRRKRLIRQIALLGNDEKKYLFLLKSKKIENKKFIQNILDEQISYQFLKMTNTFNQNYKETKIRNIKHTFIEKYLLESEKQLYQIEPYQEETYNLSNISDLIVSLNYHKSNTKDNTVRIPYYMEKTEKYIQKQDLSNYILKFAKTIDTFIMLRKILVTNIGVQYALSFTIASSLSPKQLENLQINLSNGNFFQKKYLFKVNNQKLILYDPFAIRYSQSFEHLIGEINLNGYLIPAFTATIIGILNPDLVEYLNVLFWQLGCKESVEPFIKKLKDIVYENGIIDSKCDRLIAISKGLFGGQEKLKQWVKRWF